MAMLRNPDYGWPDMKPSLIFEGCAPYHDGPTCWSDASPAGSYAFTANTPPASTDAGCPPIPQSLGLDPTKVKPISLNQHNEPSLNQCVVACNMTEVAATGVDPCTAGSITSPVAAAMSCYWGGPGFLTPDGLGICAYNCTVINAKTSTYCNSTEVKAQECVVACDPRTI
jgi:hypothetical protein